MYCPPLLASPRPSVAPTNEHPSTRVRGVVTSVFATAYVMITRVRASFVIVARLCPEVAGKQRAVLERDSMWILWTRGGGIKTRHAGFIIEIFGVDNIIVASHARVVCSNDIAVSKLAIRDWEKWLVFFFFFSFRFLMDRFSWRMKRDR